MAETEKDVEDALRVIHSVHFDPANGIRGRSGEETMGVGEIGALLRTGHDDIVSTLSQEGGKAVLLQQLFKHLVAETITPDELQELIQEVDDYKKSHLPQEAGR